MLISDSKVLKKSNFDTHIGYLLTFELEYLPGAKRLTPHDFTPPLKQGDFQKNPQEIVWDQHQKSILAQRSKVHNLVGAYESRAKHTRLGVQVE